MTTQIENGRIESARVGVDGRGLGVPVIDLYFQFEVGSQGAALPIETLAGLCELFDVQYVDQLVGRVCRVESSGVAAGTRLHRMAPAVGGQWMELR